MTVNAVEFDAIDKRFGSVHANQNISFGVRAGSIHGIVGENGAGKSTLMSILYGYYTADQGTIRLHGQPLKINNSQDAIKHGIGMVHQHFMLVDRFTVLENIILGAEGSLILDTAAARAKLLAIAQQYQLEVDPDARTETLAVGTQQRVEILKLMYRGADILILDEPTAVLTPQEVNALFDMLRQLRSQGKTILLITHKLHEVFALCDEVSVMRAGALVAQRQIENSSPDEIAALMVGHVPASQKNHPTQQRGEAILSVENLSYRDASGVNRLHPISFDAYRGEILAIAGVSGNGQSELLEILAGMRVATSGQVRYKNQTLATHLPHQAGHFRHLGIAHIPEDRLRFGAVKSTHLAFNSALGYVERLSPFRWLAPQRLIQHSQQINQQFDVRPQDPLLRFGLLSGGNQQKLVFGREVSMQPELLLVGQPTRGVDIGSIERIHRQLLDLRDQGMAIILVSVELEEIEALADRILVMCGGKITGEVARTAFDRTTIGLMMSGAHQETPT